MGFLWLIILIGAALFVVAGAALYVANQLGLMP